MSTHSFQAVAECCRERSLHKIVRMPSRRSGPGSQSRSLSIRKRCRAKLKTEFPCASTHAWFYQVGATGDRPRDCLRENLRSESASDECLVLANRSWDTTGSQAREHASIPDLLTTVFLRRGASRSPSR